jgi:hypothetical protein
MTDTFLGLVDGARRIEDGLPLVEPFFLLRPDLPQPDDVLLDDWLVSLTPDRFGHILDSLARLTAVGVVAVEP